MNLVRFVNGEGWVKVREDVKEKGRGMEGLVSRLLGEFFVTSSPREDLHSLGATPGPDEYPENTSDDN